MINSSFSPPFRFSSILWYQALRGGGENMCQLSEVVGGEDRTHTHTHLSLSRSVCSLSLSLSLSLSVCVCVCVCVRACVCVCVRECIFISLSLASLPLDAPPPAMHTWSTMSTEWKGCRLSGKCAMPTLVPFQRKTKRTRNAPKKSQGVKGRETARERERER